LRQSAQENAASPLWKQEVNRRVAEHKVRKGQPASTKSEPTEGLPNGSVAAKAAARVAARYAKAPTYSEMLAEETRSAVRSAEASSRVAVEVRAVAEPVLAGLEAELEVELESVPAPAHAPVWEPEFFTPAAPEQAFTPALTPAIEPVRNVAMAAQPSSPLAQEQTFEIRWDADMPVREPEPAVARVSRAKSVLEIPAEVLWQEGRDALDVQGVEMVEAAQPIHANLIAFPRELVATRKIRPRRAEGPYAASVEGHGQLSIFEVESSTISTEPEAAIAKGGAGAQRWVGPEWSGIELDEEPQAEIASPLPEPAKKGTFASTPSVIAMQLAPLNQRILAAIVDFSLITAAFLAAVMVAAFNTPVLPSIREIELGSVVAWALTGALYQAFFFALSRTTPGMDYANLALCTFAGKRPVLAQRCIRAAALFLSLLPLGLGVIWAIFDAHNLTWHDRLSRTYLRKG
jgi:uncharacterized RDD family membrane protein YckC